MTILTGREKYVTNKEEQHIPLIQNGKCIPLYMDSQDYSGVRRVLGHLSEDFERVCGKKADIFTDEIPGVDYLLIAGTIGKSETIDRLIKTGKLDVSGVAGKWDCFLIASIDQPFEGTKKAIVIAGANKRGTVYGLYDLGGQLGVSPLYWLADVPVKKKDTCFFIPGVYSYGEPAVKYRGFFINDEYPSLGGHVHAKYGGFTHKFYQHVFEFLLRSKGNYFWPAMWVDALHDDDPENSRLADEMGVIIGTSHHEPLMRAWKEWERYGKGDWDIRTNEEFLIDYWTKSIERMNGYESVVTIGMRGDGDEPLTKDGQVELLEKVVSIQRNILKNVTGKNPEEIPQMWAVYKEVQDVYKQGFRVPEDVIVMLCDDNWGNLRLLPDKKEINRRGGHGLYYHFDYVGGPRNHKWLNTSPLPRAWEQLNLAYKGGIDKLWIVNVGDIKPLEYPLSFFLDFAWNPANWSFDQLDEYAVLWAEKQFGEEHAREIADIITLYVKFNGRRKPELLGPDVYSLIHFREAETIVSDYNRLAERTLELKKKMPQEYLDAFFELVEFPVLACANLNDLHISTGQNRFYAKQGRALTNALADKVEQLFEKDKTLCSYYNNECAGGKWIHMMDQTHISYTYWQQPEKDVLPDLERITLPEKGEMGIALESSEKWWPGSTEEAVLPGFSPYGPQSYYIEIFNRGKGEFNYSLETESSWIEFSKSRGTIVQQERIEVSINWEKMSEGLHEGKIVVTGPDGQEVNVGVTAENINLEGKAESGTFVESNGCVSIEAEHYSRLINTDEAAWTLLPGHGRTGSALKTFPVITESFKPGEGSPCVEYRIYVMEPGEYKVKVYVSPNNNYIDKDGIKYAVSIDDETPQIANLHSQEQEEDWQNPVTTNTDWNDAVANSIRKIVTEHFIPRAGLHTVRIHMIDPGVILQKLCVYRGEEKESYLGTPESFRI